MFKKAIRMILIVPLLVLFMVLAPGASAYASSGSYDITDFDVQVDIDSSGDAYIAETITYDFSGSFNGILRDIDYSRTSGIQDLEVGILEADGSIRPFTESTGSGVNVYERDESGQIVNLRVYERSVNETKTFVYRYRLLNVAEKYNDIATFNRRVIDSGWDVPLENVTITVRIPEGATREQLRVFAHGPLTGVSTIVDERTFEFSVPLVQGTFVETLVIFPRELIPESTNIFNRDELQTILTNEGRLAEEANRQRDAAKAEAERKARIDSLKKSLFPVFMVGILGALASLVAMFMKYSKEVKPEFDGDYYRDLPGDYSPAVMTYLLTKGNTKADDIMATLMDLARKRIVSLTLVERRERGIIFKTTDEAYLLNWEDQSKMESALPHEAFLADWFINKIGGGEGLILDDLEKKAKSRTFALQFQKDYKYFQYLVKDEGARKDFFAANQMKGSGMFVGLGIFFILLGGLSLIFLQSLYGILIGALGVFLLLGLMAMNFMRKLSLYGADQTAKWKAFKKFLLDFSSMDQAEIPSLVIWEHYLVYAVSLGVAKEVIDQLPRVFNESQLNDPNLTYMRGYGNFSSFYMMNHMMSNTVQNVSSAVNASAIASSVRSSGSGMGGGFSGGSSGGGGGGGGGGAF